MKRFLGGLAALLTVLQLGAAPHFGAAQFGGLTAALLLVGLQTTPKRVVCLQTVPVLAN